MLGIFCFVLKSIVKNVILKIKERGKCMPKSSFQKLKILYIYDFLQKNTDQDVGVTVAEIISHLASFGITAERKSIYDDILALMDYGVDIITERNGSRHEYRLASREFESAEVRLLVDAVQSSRFITQKKSSALISKLKSLVGPTESKGLLGQVLVFGRIKSMEETIYYNVDAINGAITGDNKISFVYFEWTEKKQKRLRRDGQRYVVSPEALCWDNQNYYLIATENGILKHFRVDKMQSIKPVYEKRELSADFDEGRYKNSVFGMYGGRECQVTLLLKNTLAGAFIDRFGKDVIMIPQDNDCFSATVSVQISPQFFGWLCGFGSDIKILSPGDVADEYKNNLSEIVKLYEK